MHDLLGKGSAILSPAKTAVSKAISTTRHVAAFEAELEDQNHSRVATGLGHF